MKKIILFLLLGITTSVYAVATPDKYHNKTQDDLWADFDSHSKDLQDSANKFQVKASALDILMAVSKMEFSKKSNTKNFKGTLPCNALIKPEKDGKGQIIFGTNCNQQGVEIKVEDVIEQIQKEEGLIKVVCKGRECSYTSSVPSRR